jgi:hypothetical protein
MANKILLIILVLGLGILETISYGYKGLGIDRYLLGIVISQAGTFMWIINYSILSTEYYKE